MLCLEGPATYWALSSSPRCLWIPHSPEKNKGPSFLETDIYRFIRIEASECGVVLGSHFHQEGVRGEVQCPSLVGAAVLIRLNFDITAAMTIHLALIDLLALVGEGNLRAPPSLSSIERGATRITLFS